MIDFISYSPSKIACLTLCVLNLNDKLVFIALVFCNLNTFFLFLYLKSSLKLNL